MPTGLVFIAVSVDGYIARPDGDIDWLLRFNDLEEDYGYKDFIEAIDVIVMGRGTFDTMKDQRPWFYSRPVVVLSSSLDPATIPADLADKVRVLDKSPRETMAILASEGCRRVYVDGGRVIQSFLADGLIDELIITRVPIVLGGGRPLFGPTDQDVELQHLGTQAFSSGLVQSRYKVAL